MEILWFLVVIHTAFAQPGFGRSYLRNSRLCHQWTCINKKLSLSDSLPTTEEFGAVLRRLLPEEWKGTLDSVLQTCYHDRPRRYSNTCPGQAVMHCAVDQLITNCPESSLQKEDACAPVNSLAGANTMFTQSRYENIESNMAIDRRPAWFLRNYFNSKCCNLPPLLNSTVLSECGFNSMLEYYVHNVQLEHGRVSASQWRSALPAISSNNSNPTQSPLNSNTGLQIVNLSDVQANTPSTQFPPVDPLDCCDMSDFIQPSWRKECNFELNWEAQSRLVIKHVESVTSTAAPTTTSASSSVIRRDLTIVPQSCEKESCVFTKLNILSPTGAVNMEAFSKLLDNLTTTQPSWNSAKARVVTTCLRKPLAGYTAQCDMNRVLACTFDVLTENCPNARRDDQCKHTSSKDGQEMTCQISSSKYRPKHRREICTLPEIVDRNILKECGLSSLSKMESVTTVIKPKTYRWFNSKYKCQDLTPSTTCLMSKMDIINKYGFLDYFKTKDRIRKFTGQGEWSTLQNVYMSAFGGGPLYREHCNSAKKLLNVVDAMLMTCPESKRKNTAQCSNVFNQITNTPANRNVTQEYTQQILNHFHHVFFPSLNTPKRPKHSKKLKKTPLYNFGILNDENAPKVTTIDITPTQKPVEDRPPVVLLPVYMRIPNSNLMIRPFENGVLRSPFALHEQIARSHTSPISSTPSTSQLISTTPNKLPVASSPFSTTPVPAIKPISTTHFVPNEQDLQFDMVKPE